MKRRVLTTITVCMGVMAVSALMAVGAQAAPHWVVCEEDTGGAFATSACNSAGSGWELEALSAGQKRSTEAVGSTGFALTFGILGNPEEEIVCGGLIVNGGFIEGPDKNGAESLEFTECVMPAAPACEVPNILTNPVESELVSTTEVLFEPRTGTQFATLVIEGGCALEGEYAVTGKVVGEALEGEASEEVHTLTFPAAGTELEFEGSPMTFSGGASLRFATHRAWAVAAGETAATNLCKTNAKAECEAKEAWPLGTGFEAALEAEVKFVFDFGVEAKEPPCKVSVMKGTTTVAGAPLVGELSGLTFKECGAGNFAVLALHTPYRVEVEAGNGGNGTMTWRSGGGGRPAFKITSGVLECIYGVKEVSFAITGGGLAGGEPAKASNNGVSLELEAGSGTGCGAIASWEGVEAVKGVIKYRISAPQPLFVTR